jgi:WD40 repeat protein
MEHCYVSRAPETIIQRRTEESRTLPLQTASDKTVRFQQVLSTTSSSSNGKPVVSAPEHKTASLWDARRAFTGHSSSVFAVAFSPASASEDRTVRLWDPATGGARRTLKSHLDSVLAVVFLPDGKLVASASADRTVKLWDPAIGAARHTFKDHADWVRTVAFSPDGKLLVSASAKTVKLWDPHGL